MPAHPNLDDLVRKIRSAFAAGPPNGTLEGWPRDRLFNELSALVAPARARNVTMFDYAFCNRHEATFSPNDDGSYAVLSLQLSFITDVYSIHWTLYDRGGRSGRVVELAPSEEAERIATNVRSALALHGFAPIPLAWSSVPVGGIELELSGRVNVTVGKCLFQDHEG